MEAIGTLSIKCCWGCCRILHTNFLVIPRDIYHSSDQYIVQGVSGRTAYGYVWSKTDLPEASYDMFDLKSDAVVCIGFQHHVSSPLPQKIR